jgi:hypothetical protein
MLYLITRLILVPLGYMLAIAAATVVLVVPQWNTYIRGTGLNEADIFILISHAFGVFSLIGTLAFPLAAVVIIVCEVLIVRSWMAYATLGALIAFGLAGAVQRMNMIQIDAPPELYWLDFRQLIPVTPVITLAAGLSAGLVYWLAAGRPGRSGRRRIYKVPAAQNAAGFTAPQD